MDGTRKGPAVDRERLLHVGSKTLGELRRGHGEGAAETFLKLRANRGSELVGNLTRHVLERACHVGSQIVAHIGAHDLVQALGHRLARHGRHLVKQGCATFRRRGSGICDELLDELFAKIGLTWAQPLAMCGQPRCEEALDKGAREF